MKIIDLSGKRFGKLTVIGRAEVAITPNGTKKTMWKCQCDCGNIVIRQSQNLRSVKCPSCGCEKARTTSERTLKDLSGKKFGRLTVISRSNAVDKSGHRMKWVCQCDCGKTIEVLGNNLVRGHTLSCGCYRDEKRIKNKTTHGYRKTRAYSVYSKMKERCYNVNNPSYHRYGGRGITICEEWLNNPKSFIEWAYDHGFKEEAKYGECTIDRVDNNKGYSPSNCRVVDEKTQANNRRSNLLIPHNGEVKTLAEWRDLFGLTQSKAYYHLVTKKRTIQYLLDNGII